MYCLYVGVDYTYIDVNALAQGIKSFLASHVWFQAVAGARTYGMYVSLYVSLYVCVYIYIYIIIFFFFFFKQSCEAPPVDFTAPYWGAHPPHGDSAPHVPRHPRHQRNRYHSPPGHEADDSGLGTAATYNYTAFSQRKLTHSSNINYHSLGSLV